MLTVNPNSKFSWTPNTVNTDGTPIAAGEITGYVIGIRSATATGSVVGTYPAVSSPTGPLAVSDAFSALNLVLKPDTYFAAVQSVGPLASPWSAEVEFIVGLPQPSAPTGFTVA